MEDRHHPDKPESQKQLLLAFVVNTLFVCIELAGGLFTNSVAILSDAIHDLGDSFALGTAWYFERISRKRRTQRHTYGFRRYSVLGAVINAMVLIAGSVLVIREAILRLSAPEEVHSTGMILLALLGIVMNGFAFSRIRKGHSHNVEVVRLHLLEDVLGWVAVLLGAIAIKIWGLVILDPVLSLVVSVWILIQVIRRLWQSLRIILQIAPAHIDTDQISNMILQLPGVHGIHDTHLWTMDGEYHVLTIHVVVDPGSTLQELASIKGRIRQNLLSLKIDHATIEFEYPDEECVHEEC